VTELGSLFVWRREAVVVAAIAGEMDISNATDFEAEIGLAVGNDADGLVLDLAGLTFMDSSGVHMLFRLADRLRTAGRRMAVIAPPGSAPRRLLELSGPGPQSWIHDVEDAAIAAVRDVPRHN
jgi:anti-anti-sigma factor